MHCRWIILSHCNDLKKLNWTFYVTLQGCTAIFPTTNSKIRFSVPFLLECCMGGIMVGPLNSLSFDWQENLFWRHLHFPGHLPINWGGSAPAPRMGKFQHLQKRQNGKSIAWSCRRTQTCTPEEVNLFPGCFRPRFASSLHRLAAGLLLDWKLWSGLYSTNIITLSYLSHSKEIWLPIGPWQRNSGIWT